MHSPHHAKTDVIARFKDSRRRRAQLSRSCGHVRDVDESVGRIRKLLDESSLRITPCSSSRASTAAWAATARWDDEEQQHTVNCRCAAARAASTKVAPRAFVVRWPGRFAPGTTCAVHGSTSTCIRPSSRRRREAAGVAGVDGESLLRCSAFTRRRSGARRFSSISRATSARARISGVFPPPPPPPKNLLSDDARELIQAGGLETQVSRGRAARASTTFRDDIGEAKNPRNGVAGPDEELNGKLLAWRAAIRRRCQRATPSRCARESAAQGRKTRARTRAGIRDASRRSRRGPPAVALRGA